MMLWIELASQFLHGYRDAQHAKPAQAQFARAISLYAVWCVKSGPPEAAEAASINFYEDVWKFAIRSKRQTREQLLSDLIANFGLGEVDRVAMLCAPLVAKNELKEFLADAERAAQTHSGRSRKRRLN